MNLKETECAPSSLLPEDVPVLERQDAVDAKDVGVVETTLPKKNRALSEAQKDNRRLGRAIARKNRDEKAEVKLDEMVDNCLKPLGQDPKKMR